VQFERSHAVSCELRSLRLHVALLFGAGHVFGRCCAVGGLFCFFLALNLYRAANQIGDAGASSLGEGLKCNSSVRKLYLVSCRVYVCMQRCCLVPGMFLVGVVQWGACFASSWR
jgi:hypothetical protein